MSRPVRFASQVCFVLLASTLPACSCGTTVHHGTHDGGDVDGGGTGTDAGFDAGGPMHDDAGYLRSCFPDSPDTEGCACVPGEAPRACWPYTLDPAYRHVGLCTDGTQSCVTEMEFSSWGPCLGATAPDVELCGDMVDNDCNGGADCLDAYCSPAPECNIGPCPEFGTRPCYDGPDGTAGVGTCRAGTQTCTGGTWGACDGEVLPGPENCGGPEDRNCNHFAGCFDLFVCIADPACMEHCTDPLDAGCVCPDGTGDVATCPRGMIARTMGTLGGSIECCPCTSHDCGGGNTDCCEEPVCAGDPYCGGLYCPTLPASCMGRVSADCDDFPEDCDEPCCPCYGDCSGP